MFAAAIIPIWLLVLHGSITTGNYVPPFVWHAHEMVFGFATAVIAGFLLTAVGNWTQRETIVGVPLLALAALWIAGRIAFAAATSLPHGTAAIVDLAFLPALALSIAPALVRAKNRRNFVMLGILAALFSANLVVHADALGMAPGHARTGCILGVDVVVTMMVMMAGRVFPMFTRNATGVESIRSLPALDRLAMLSALAMTLADLGDSTRWQAFTAAAASIFIAARAVPWMTRRVLRVPLLWILHVGYAWIPIGLALRAASHLIPSIAESIALHALTAGAIGALTLGMMARVSLGHTGRALVAPRAVAIAFGLVTLGAIVRVVVPLLLATSYERELQIAGVAWSAAFAIFAVAYAPMLASPRVDGKSG